jgi:hypothetical protein
MIAAQHPCPACLCLQLRPAACVSSWTSWYVLPYLGPFYQLGCVFGVVLWIPCLVFVTGPARLLAGACGHVRCSMLGDMSSQ